MSTIHSSPIHFIPPATVGTTGQFLAATDNVGGTDWVTSPAPIYPISAPNGGTGVSSPVAHGIMVAEGASPMNSISLTDGQVLIGAGGLDPIATHITGLSGITVTNAAGFVGIGPNKDILPFNTIQIFVSKRIGNDLTGTGSQTNPFATINKALTFAGSPAFPVIIEVMDAETYDEQILISVNNLYINAPTAQIIYTGLGDGITFGIGVTNGGLLALAVLGVTGAGNSLVNNGTAVFEINIYGIQNGPIVNNSTGGFILNSKIIQVNILNSGGGPMFYVAAIITGTITGPIYGISSIGAISPLFQVSGILVDTIGGFYTGIINSPAITHTNLATAGHVNIIVPPTVTAQYQITGITLNGVSGTNFSGIGGDRDLVITDGTNTWSLIPAAIVQAFAGANAQWGSLSIPLPTAIDMSQFSVAGTNIYAAYANGTTDYTAGSLTISLQYTKVTN